jgi:hypothetical protein
MSTPELARQLLSSSQIKSAQGFYSHKNRCFQYCEGDTERFGCLIREFDDNITSYATQPCSMKFQIYGKWRRYTPDSLVIHTTEGAYYEEIKTYDYAQKLEFIFKQEFLEQAFDEIVKIPLKLNTVLTESKCKTICNLAQLYSYRHQPLEQDKLSHVLPAIPDIKLTGLELEDVCTRRGVGKNFAWTMAAYGKMDYSNAEVLKRSSTLEVVNG